MNWSPARLALGRWQFTVVAFVLLGALGVAATLSIPRTEDPTLDPPNFVINAVLPGSTPSDIEQLVTRPVEKAIYQLDGVREIRSQSRDGLSTTQVEFVWGTNPETAYEQVNREMNTLRQSLPEGLARLDVIRARPLQVSIVQVALVSEHLPMRKLEKLADRLSEKLGAIPGVSEARYWGAPPTEMRVSLDPVRMAALHLPASQVVAALQAAGTESPIGSVNTPDRRFEVEREGAFRTSEAISTVAVRSEGRSVVHVGDVARVGWAQGEATHITRFNGQRALLVSVSQAKNEDVTRLTGEINRTLDEFEPSLPGGVKLERSFEQARNVHDRLSLLGRDFSIALGLVVLTLLPLGLRASLVVVIAIPMSLLIGMMALQHLGYTLNQVAVGGFVVALGLLVDDAIVVVENVSRWLREGASRTEAAIRGTEQITLAVIGCTVCLMLSFLPLLALPEGPGEFIRSLPVTVLTTVAGSMLVALTLVPAASAWLLKPQGDHGENVLLRGLTRGIHKFYAPVLGKALDRPRTSLAALLALTALAVPLVMVIGTSLFPPAETPQFLIRVETPQGSSMTRTDEAVRRVEAVLARHPEVDWYSSNVGRGNPQIYYNIAQHEVDPAFGEVAVGLHRWESGASDQLLETLRQELDAQPGVRVRIMTFVNGPAVEAPVVLRISGPDLQVLDRLSHEAEAVLQATPGLRNVSNPLRVPRTTLHIDTDDAALAALGVQAGAVRQALQISLSGATAAHLRDAEGDSYPVNVRLPMGEHNTLQTLQSIYVPLPDGSAVPLATSARLTLQSQPARIDRIGRERNLTLTGDIAPGFLTSRVTADAYARIQHEVSLPPGYTLSLGGEAETQRRSFAGFGPAIVVSSLGILAVLVLEFGKLRTVAVVFGIVPFGFFGAVVALWLTGQSLSFTAMVGLIALIGIEIKNSILLVDFTEQLRAEGVPMRQAVERAGELRFLPVVLTSVTAILGLLPLALENNGLLSPTAITLIGGLVASTLLARIATPVMYLLIARGDKGEPA